MTRWVQTPWLLRMGATGDTLGARNFAAQAAGSRSDTVRVNTIAAQGGGDMAAGCYSR